MRAASGRCSNTRSRSLHGPPATSTEGKSIGVIGQGPGILSGHRGRSDAQSVEGFLRGLFAVENCIYPQDTVLDELACRRKAGEVQRANRAALVGEQGTALELAHQPRKEIHPILGAQAVRKAEPGDALLPDPGLQRGRLPVALGTIAGAADLRWGADDLLAEVRKEVSHRGEAKHMRVHARLEESEAVLRTHPFHQFE